MGPIAEPFRLRSKWSNVLRDGGFKFKPRIGLGLGMLASYNPSFRYLRESQGFYEEVAMIGTVSFLITWDLIDSIGINKLFAN